MLAPRTNKIKSLVETMMNFILRMKIVKELEFIDCKTTAKVSYGVVIAGQLCDICTVEIDPVGSAVIQAVDGNIWEMEAAEQAEKVAAEVVLCIAQVLVDRCVIA